MLCRPALIARLVTFKKTCYFKMLQGCWEECQSDAECWDWTRHNIKASILLFSLSAEVQLFSLEPVRFLCEM
jgi:hypothetical protein